MKNFQTYLYDNLGAQILKHCRRIKRYSDLVRRWRDRDLLQDDVGMFIVARKCLVDDLYKAGLRPDNFSMIACPVRQTLFNAFINWTIDQYKSKDGKQAKFEDKMKCMDEDRMAKQVLKGEVNMVEEMMTDLTTNDILDGMEEFRDTLVLEEDIIVWSYIVWPMEAKETYRLMCQDKLNMPQMTFFRRVKAMKGRAYKFIKEQK